MKAMGHLSLRAQVRLSSFFSSSFHPLTSLFHPPPSHLLTLQITRTYDSLQKLLKEFLATKSVVSVCLNRLCSIMQLLHSCVILFVTACRDAYFIFGKVADGSNYVNSGPESRKASMELGMQDPRYVHMHV